jgi:hypothetical protein
MIELFCIHKPCLNIVSRSVSKEHSLSIEKDGEMLCCRKEMKYVERNVTVHHGSITHREVGVSFTQEKYPLSSNK